MALLRMFKHFRIAGEIKFISWLDHAQRVSCGLSPLLKIRTKTSCAQLEIRNFQTSSCHQKKREDVTTKAESPVLESNKLQEHLRNLQLKVVRNKQLTQSEVENMFLTLKSQSPGLLTSMQALLMIRCCGNSLQEMEEEQRTKLVNHIWNTLHVLQCPLDVSHYNMLLKVYLENEHTFHPKKFLDSMNRNKIAPNRVTYQHLMSQTCQLGNVDDARELLEIMKAKNMEINEDIYNQLIIGHAKANNITDMEQTLQIMRNADLSPNMSTYTALACGHAIHGDIGNVLSVIQQAENEYLKLSNKELVDIIYMLTVNNYGNLSELVLQRLSSDLLVNDCFNIIFKLINRDYHEMAFKLLMKMPPKYYKSSSFIRPSGSFFIHQIVKKNLPSDVILGYCEKLKEAGLNEKALLVAAESSILFHRTDDAILFLKKFKSQGLTIYEQFTKRILRALGKQRNETIISILSSMSSSKELVLGLTKAGHKQDPDQVNALLTHYNEAGTSLNQESCASLFQFWCDLHDLDKSLHYKKQLDELFPDFKLNSFWTFRLAILMIENKKFNDAECLIYEHCSMLETKPEKMNSLLVSEILKGLTQSDDIRHPGKVLEIFISFGLCKAETYFFVPVIEAYLLRDNITGAVNEFLRVVDKYCVTPATHVLYQKLIMNDDQEQLQKVIDATILVHGINNVHLKLAWVFISCGELTKAQQVLQTPGLTLTAKRIEEFCGFYLKKGEIKVLVTFLKLAKEVLGLSMSCIYHQLMITYVKAENVEEALGVLKMMQDDGVAANKHTLQLLETFLLKKNYHVPFSVLCAPDHSSEYKTFLQMLSSQDVNGALDIYKNGSLSMKDGTPKVEEVCKLIELLLKDNKLEDAVMLSDELFSAGFYPSRQTSRLIASKCSEVGDSSSLLKLKRRLPKEISKLIPFSDFLAMASVNSGLLYELLDSLEYEVDIHLKDFPAGALMTVLSNRQDILDRVRRIVEIYYQAGSPSPRNMLWAHFMITKNFEEAKAIFKATPEMQANIFDRNVRHHIRSYNDLEISQELLTQAKHSELKFRSKGLIYSSHINVLITVGKMDEAVTTLSEAERLIGLDNISLSTLNRLAVHLKLSGKEVPYRAKGWKQVGSLHHRSSRET